MFAWSHDWTFPLPLRKTVSAFLFEICRLLKQYVLNCTRYWACRYKRYYGVGSFHWWQSSGFFVSSSKKVQTHQASFCCTRNLPGFVWNSGCLDNSELPNILPRYVKGEYFAKGTEKCKILGSLLGKEVENLDDHGCPKIGDLGEADEEIGFLELPIQTQDYVSLRRARGKIAW